jgi:GNAT superfamily N-acetyltransferase
MRTGDRWLPALDSFFSGYLGCDIARLEPGETRVCDSPRREKPELHYANAFPVWCFVTHNRAVVSTHPLLLGTVSKLCRGMNPARLKDVRTAELLAGTATRVLGLDPGCDYAAGPVLFGPPETYCGRLLQPCRVVTEPDRAALERAGLLDPSLLESVADGTCFAGYDDDKPVALCGVTPVPHMADKVADIALPGTLEPYRRRGFGRTVLSAVTQALHACSRIPFYLTSSHNTASIRTAASVGYLEYGWQFRVKAPGA